MGDHEWQMSIGDGLDAHFYQPDGSSRPGTDWDVALRYGDSSYHVMVRAYLSEDANRATRKDTAYQVQVVLEYVGVLLSQGWTPDDPSDLTVVIPNRPGSLTEKPWWRVW